jgi:ATP-dependent Lon protease
MPQDIKQKKEKIKSTKKKDDKKKKLNDSSDSEEDDFDSEYETASETTSESDEMDKQEYHKLISKIFPSKYMNKKVKSGEKLKKIVEKEKEKEKEKKSSSKKNKKIVEEDDEEQEEDEEEESEEEDKPKSKKYKNSKFNIIFTIGDKDEDDDDDEYDDEYDEDYEEESEYSTEDEDEEVSTDESDDSDESEDEEEEEVVKKKKDKSPKKEKNREKEESDKDTTKKVEDNEVIIKLKELLTKNPTDKSIKKCIDAYEEDIKNSKKRTEKKLNKQKEKNMRIFRKIIKDKNTTNDFSFYEKMDLDKQIKIIKELREINKITRIEKPYKMTLLESDIPIQLKAAAMKKINSLRHMEPGSGEYYKIKNWVDNFMRVPFVKTQELPIQISDGVDKCNEFMENAKKTLDDAVYGLNDAKMQIMQMLGQLITNPKSIGTSIAIHGPPGTGKTTLVKEGISKILNRPFAFIALGGATDSSFLEGHGYTYEGSTWGKIVQILIDSQCMNPVIYFDELDKISDTPRGEEITGILTHLTDTSQNSEFHDKYFSEINFDLSKCLFIFSYNDESKVNPILKDRMYRIKTKGYSGKEKTVITNSYLLPKIREQVKFNTEDIIIKEDVITHIIDTHCNKEDGVRNLKRCLEIIHTKLNLYRLMKPDSSLFEGEMTMKVEFPYKVTKDIVDKLIKKDTENLSALWAMYS